jgi:hypothetical protein
VREGVSEKLREPFPPEAIGLRPVVTCPACKGVDVVCDKHHPAVLCETCGATAPEGHEHHEYIGHAWVRERFTEADPDWDWEPLATDDRGLPLLDKHGGLWIRLTIGGRTALGYGDAPDTYGGNAVKIAIGDAFRNAAQNFGVALEMWKRRGPAAAVTAPAVDEDPRRAKELRDELTRHFHRKAKNFGQLVGAFRKWCHGEHEFRDAPAHVLLTYKEHLGIT